MNAKITKDRAAALLKKSKVSIVPLEEMYQYLPSYNEVGILFLRTFIPPLLGHHMVSMNHFDMDGFVNLPQPE